MNYNLKMTKQASKDLEDIKKNTVLLKKAKAILQLIKENPFKTPPRYEKLVGDLSGAYSRRLNIQHRIVYEVRESENTIVILRMKTHYEK